MRLTRRSLFAAFAAALGLAAMPAVSEASVVTDTMPSTTSFYYAPWDASEPDVYTAYDGEPIHWVSTTGPLCRGGSCAARAAVRGPAKAVQKLREAKPARRAVRFVLGR